MSAAETTLAGALPEAGIPLLRDARLGMDPTFDPIRFEATFAAAGRRLGTTPLGGDAALADEAGHVWSVAGWGHDEAGRAFLLLHAVVRIPHSEQVGWVDELYRAGGMRERQAVLRPLALLPDPARFLATALDACRTSTQPVFEAIACENPYPAAYFPEPSFNQLVLKAVFTEVALARILGLDARRTPELARMAADYAAERRAAGRSVPADLATLIDA